MVINSYQQDIDSQVAYAARKYGGNLPPSVAKAHAQSLAYAAMKNYDKSKGNVKTYLNKRLQKLSRIAYKATTPLNIPESRLMSRAKIRDFIDEHKDTFGYIPSPEQISKTVGVSLSDARSHTQESASISSESAFTNISGNSIDPSHVSEVNIVRSLPSDLRSIGHDIYIANMSEKDISKKHGIGRTTFFSKKRKIDDFIKKHSGLSNIQYN